MCIDCVSENHHVTAWAILRYWFFPFHDVGSLAICTNAIRFSRHGGHLGFLNGTVLAIFDLQIALILSIKSGVNWPFTSGEEQYKFSTWRPSLISDQNDFSYF